MFEAEEDGRIIPMAVVGMRVYCEDGHRTDERGKYEGWSDRFDEEIPIYSPRICPLNTVSSKNNQDNDEVDESLDDVIKPAPGHKRVWAVPRVRKTTSSKYMSLINNFCEEGGIDLVLDILEKKEFSDAPDQFNVCVMAIIVNMLSLASPIYHRDAVADFGPKLVELTRKRLLSVSDTALREVKNQHIEAIAKALDNINKRLIPKEDR